MTIYAMNRTLFFSLYIGGSKDASYDRDEMAKCTSTWQVPNPTAQVGKWTPIMINIHLK